MADPKNSTDILNLIEEKCANEFKEVADGQQAGYDEAFIIIQLPDGRQYGLTCTELDEEERVDDEA